MNVIDFLVDWKGLVGETVTVTGCLIRDADVSRVLCSAGPQGHFRIGSETLAREDLRRSLRNCAGFTERDECRADVTGNVTENAIGDPELADAAMNWAATPAPQQPAPKTEASQLSTVPEAENEKRKNLALDPHYYEPGHPGYTPPVSPHETSHRDGETSETDFISIIDAARSEYKNAPNDFTKGAARVHRRERLCQFARGLVVRGWTGTIAKLSSNSSGKGVLIVAIGPQIKVGTTNNELSDAFEHTLVEGSSNVSPWNPPPLKAAAGVLATKAAPSAVVANSMPKRFIGFSLFRRPLLPTREPFERHCC
jgi:hypothetical protein